jgi:serine/threonine-protein kinase
MITAPSPSPEQVFSQLERMLASRVFSRSARLCRFLRFSVESALSGTADQIKEQLIGVEVFDRKAGYDPRIDPIVRVEARRLRAKLKAYYASAGRGDGVVISFPKGSDVPVIKERGTAVRTAIARKCRSGGNSAERLS